MASSIAISSFIITPGIGAQQARSPFRRAGTLFDAGSCQSRPVRRHVVSMSQAERGGGNNLNVNGKQPTSPIAWTEMQKVLRDTGVKVAAPQEVEPLQERGAVVIDIRPASDYNKYYIPDAVNIAFYRPIQGWSGKQAARRIAYAFFGVLNGTEYNPDFIAEVEEVADKDTPVILVCNLGSSPQEEGDDSEQLKGTSRSQTRSLMAAYELANIGYTNLYTLRGGFRGWIKSERDVCSNVYDMSQ